MPPGHRALTPAQLAELDRRWDAACAANPRLHDGPIVSVHGLDAVTGRLTLGPETFKRLVVQTDALDLGVRLLGVKGLLIAPDRRGTPHTLIARRGRQTRIYGGLFELAPAGGVQQTPSHTLASANLVTTLVDEAREEVGLFIDPAAARAIAFVEDETARCVDAIVRADLRGPIDPATPPTTPDQSHAWEYSESRWVPLAAADALSRDATLVPVARIVLRWLATRGA